MHIGNKIRELVRKSEISVVDFANKIDVTKQHVYYIYERAHINTELLEKICEVLEVPIKDFFTDSTELKVEEDLIKENKDLLQQINTLTEKVNHLSDVVYYKDELIKSNEARIVENEARINELKDLLLAYKKLSTLLKE